MTTFDGVIFDLDGTLLDSMGVWEEVDRSFLGARNIPVPEDYMRAVGALSFHEAAEYTIRRFSLQERPEDLTAEWHAMAQREYQEKVPLKSGALAFLTLLRQREIPMAVATASDPLLYRPALHRIGILDWFHSFTSLQEVGGVKGQPEIYLRAAEKMKLLPERCFVFEDLYAGLFAAKRAGFQTAAVYDACAPQEQELLRKTADLYLLDFTDPRLYTLL